MDVDKDLLEKKPYSKERNKLFNYFFSDFNYRKILVFYFIAFMIIIFIELLITVNLTCDYPKYEQHTYSFSTNPYISDSHYSKYPAFYFIFMGTLGLLGIHSTLGIRLVLGVFNAINSILMFYLYIYIVKFIEREKFERFTTKRIYKTNNQSDKKDSRGKMNLNISSLEDNIIFRALFFPIFFFFFPHNILMLEGGDNDEISLFFLILGLIFFLRNQLKLSAALIGIGTMFKIFPVFFFVAVSFYFLRKKEFRKLATFTIILLLSMILISLPYLIMDFKAYLIGITIHASRRNTGFSYGVLLPELYKIFITIDIPNLIEIQISYLFFIQIFIFSFGLLTYYIKNIKFGLRETIISYVIITSIFPFIAFQDHFMTIYRYLPFLILIMYFQPINRLNLKNDNNLELLFKFVIFTTTTTFIYKMAEYLLQFFTQDYSASLFLLFSSIIIILCTIKYLGSIHDTDLILNIIIILLLFTIQQTAYYSLTEGLTTPDRMNLFIIRSFIFYPVYYLFFSLKIRIFLNKKQLSLRIFQKMKIFKR